MKKWIPGILVIIVVVIISFNFEKTTDNESIDKGSLVVSKKTEEVESADLKDAGPIFKVKDMESQIVSMSADDTELKAVEYCYYLIASEDIPPEQYKDYQFDVLDTPLHNPYSIQQMHLSSKEADGDIYELLISTTYSSTYSDELLNELKNTPGFQLVLTQGDDTAFIY